MNRAAWVCMKGQRDQSMESCLMVSFKVLLFIKLLSP